MTKPCKICSIGFNAKTSGCYCSEKCRGFSKNKKMKESRKRTNNAITKRYEKTPNGFLVRKYRNMLSRVLGIQKPKYHLYKDLEILSKEEFYSWSKKDKIFWKLFKRWEKSNYDRKLCPTVDRRDPRKGYSLNNMFWATHSDNSRDTRQSFSIPELLRRGR